MILRWITRGLPRVTGSTGATSASPGPGPAPTHPFRSAPCASVAQGAACAWATPRDQWPDAVRTLQAGRKRSAGAALRIWILSDVF